MRPRIRLFFLKQLYKRFPSLSRSVWCAYVIRYSHIVTGYNVRQYFLYEKINKCANAPYTLTQIALSLGYVPLCTMSSHPQGPCVGPTLTERVGRVSQPARLSGIHFKTRLLRRTQSCFFKEKTGWKTEGHHQRWIEKIIYDIRDTKLCFWLFTGIEEIFNVSLGCSDLYFTCWFHIRYDRPSQNVMRCLLILSVHRRWLFKNVASHLAAHLSPSE